RCSVDAGSDIGVGSRLWRKTRVCGPISVIWCFLERVRRGILARKQDLLEEQYRGHDLSERLLTMYPVRTVPARQIEGWIESR
ncbi:MAG TPA: hypothetical protein VFO40_08640, partial [Chthoniobacterales bacterium]|nr:hypothetical protein [Chthoniobacterales bacterium]